MKKLKLAVFNTQPPHLYFGGVERRIVETAQSLHSQVDTTVYSGTKAGFRKPAQVNDTQIVPCFSTDALFPVDNWFFNNTLAGAVDTINADVYEAHAARIRSTRAPRKRRASRCGATPGAGRAV